MKIDFNEIEEIKIPHMNNGDGETIAKMEVNEIGRFIETRIPPGSSIGLHKQESNNDINYIIEGQGEAICDDEKEILRPGVGELEDDIHNKLEELTSLEFESMHWKKFYEGVEIDKNYNVYIYKNGEKLVPNDLSKGGQLVLALAFMTALNSLSGFELPIIIDTPLGRLDEPIKENIGRYIPEFTKDKQLTLLVTGSEYSDEFRKEIRGYVGKEYELEYIQEQDGITNIKTKK